jgi:hypothetical protein
MGDAALTSGLCARCIHARRVGSKRGSVFLLCERARTDPHFDRYPRLPVLNCPGFETAEAGDGEGE